jgi:ribose transport system permease protein
VGLTKALNQERIVLMLAILLFAGFSLLLPKFLTPGNVLDLVRSVSVLGILGIAMAVVVIGRGVDLSIVANMAISVAWALDLADHGMNLGLALGIGLAFAVLMGLISGVLVAYVEIPALFATLAMGAFIYGFGRFRLLTQDVIALPDDSASIAWIGTGRLFGAPMPVILLAGFALMAFVFLRYTTPGRMIYGIGDNYLSARITGLPVRPVQVAQYALSGAIAYAAGIITATGVNSMNTRIVNSTLIYDIILVVVLGGVGLSGGKGGVRNVLVGTVLIGILLNGMTIMDVQYTLQNVIKSLILLIAIVVDSVVNPRDEQTAQQGDI